MFKRFFFLGAVAGVFASLVAWIYSSVYKSMIADFTEVTGFWHLLCFSLMITLGISIIGTAIYALLKNRSLAAFICNFILSGFSVSLVFYVFLMDDPEFKNEDTMAMIDYFKGYMIPFVFIPALSWMSFKPLFIK
ncbi:MULTISPECIES: hypothetical protein [Fluviicola]|uniref:hypothetical protein n=1 Tax=Fluviicola TaxID=332102 RepID=UPI003137BFE3